MPDTVAREYRIQVISQRYIKNKVLENYVDQRVEEFGANWTYSKARDNKISFTALRELTEAELDQLQGESYSTNQQPLFVD